MNLDKIKGKKENKTKIDPEGHRYGNFINYYTFHPAEERIQQLPQDIWHSEDSKYSALDIGCNAGNLSAMLYNFLQSNVSSPQEKCEISLLGVDLDPILIERAREQNSTTHGIKFECLDFLSKNSKKVLSEYMKNIKRSRFDIAFCFSITMWIHLNHGDSGLIEFLKAVCEISDLIVIEPQQWKSYRNASRRLRRANTEDFLLLNKLNYRGDMQMHIANILQSECNFCNVMITNENSWQRKLLIYRRKN